MDTWNPEMYNTSNINGSAKNSFEARDALLKRAGRHVTTAYSCASSAICEMPSLAVLGGTTGNISQVAFDVKGLI